MQRLRCWKNKTSQGAVNYSTYTWPPLAKKIRIDNLKTVSDSIRSKMYTKPLASALGCDLLVPQPGQLRRRNGKQCWTAPGPSYVIDQCKKKKKKKNSGEKNVHISDWKMIRIWNKPNRKESVQYFEATVLAAKQRLNWNIPSCNTFNNRLPKWSPNRAMLIFPFKFN